MIFIGEKNHFEQLSCKKSMCFYDVNQLPLFWEEIENGLAFGESMIFASICHLEFLEKLWIFSSPGRLTKNAIVKSQALGCTPTEFFPSKARYLYVRPPHHYAIHGVDEEPRAELIPIIVDCDRFGTEKGTVGLMVKNYDNSLAKGRFKGSFWYIFAIDNQVTSMSMDAWNHFCEAALKYQESDCFISRLTPEYPIYDKGERVRIDYRLENCSDSIQSAVLLMEVFDNRKNKVSIIGEIELTLNMARLFFFIL